MSKGYLYIDFRDNTSNQIKSCLLLCDEIENIVKFTSYCTCLNMFLNTLFKNNPDVRKNIYNNNLTPVSLYYKKTKNGEKINAIYEKDSDLFYANINDVYNFLKKEYLIFYNGNINDDEKIKKVYTSLSDLINSNITRSKIIGNFNEHFDFDKNPDNISYINSEFYKKIAAVNVNIIIALEYVFKDSFKKMAFLKRLEEVTNKKVITEEKLQINKKKVDYKLLSNGFNAVSMINSINKTINRFLNVKEPKKEEDNSYSMESDDETIEYYLRMIEQEDLDEDLKDDLRLYVDAQREFIQRQNR